MAKAKHTPTADQDLVQISTHIAHDNPTAAFRWLDDMQQACDLLAAQPGLGQQLQSNRLGLVGRHVFGNYLIYYRPIADGVEILHVVHGARDQDRIV